MINLIAMDMGLSIGFFAIFALFGSIDYATVFSLASFMNETAITVIGLLLLTGAMAKSANIPLHSWLPGSMEGLIGVIHYIFTIFYITIFSIYYDNSYNIVNLNILCPIISSIPSTTLYSITGNMLGDGSISQSKKIPQLVLPPDNVKVNIL